MLPDLEALVKQFSPKIIAPNELCVMIKKHLPIADTQLFVIGNKGASCIIDGVKISMVSADHSSNAQLTSFKAATHEVGECVGYVMEFENGFRIYHSGDTGLMADMKYIIHDFYKPDLAILPIGNVYTMGPKEAAYASKMINAAHVIPEHYATFPSLVQTADEFIKYAREYSPNTEVNVLSPGEEFKI
jgi:L-ascorbate metabolism protein UlaG (beta-lactamase superfamily)